MKPTGDMPVILAAGTSGILLHETIGHAFEADLVRSNESPLAHSLGEKIADPAVSIIDDGGLPHQRGSLNFDDEGTGSSRTPLVEDGVLRKFLHDKTTARQFSAPLTGSGRRESYRFAPMPRMTCTFMEGGAQTRDEIVASVEQGIIAETFADGRVSIAGGDFEFRIKNGWLVNNGKIDVPVKDVIVAGNGLEMLHNISMVANDAQMDKGGWTCGKRGQQVPVSNGMPTVLVTSLAIGEADDAA